MRGDVVTGPPKPVRPPTLAKFLEDAVAGGTYAVIGGSGCIEPATAAFAIAVMLLSRKPGSARDERWRRPKTAMCLRARETARDGMATLARHLEEAGVAHAAIADTIEAKFHDIHVVFGRRLFGPGWEITGDAFASRDARGRILAMTGGKKRETVQAEAIGHQEEETSRSVSVLDGAAGMKRLRTAFDALELALTSAGDEGTYHLEVVPETHMECARLTCACIRRDQSKPPSPQAAILKRHLESLIALHRPVHSSGPMGALMGTIVHATGSSTLMAAQSGKLKALMAQVEAMVEGLP